MAKITRQNANITPFAYTATDEYRRAYNLASVNSGNGDGKNWDKVVTSSSWSTGFNAQGIIPSTENWVNNTFGITTEILTHVMQMGIPEWTLKQDYYINSRVNHGGFIWKSTVNLPTQEPTATSTQWTKEGGAFGGEMSLPPNNDFDDIESGYQLHYAESATALNGPPAPNGDAKWKIEQTTFTDNSVLYLTQTAQDVDVNDNGTWQRILNATTKAVVRDWHQLSSASASTTTPRSFTFTATANGNDVVPTFTIDNDVVVYKNGIRLSNNGASTIYAIDVPLNTVVIIGGYVTGDIIVVTGIESGLSSVSEYERRTDIALNTEYFNTSGKLEIITVASRRVTNVVTHTVVVVNGLSALVTCGDTATDNMITVNVPIGSSFKITNYAGFANPKITYVDIVRV